MKECRSYLNCPVGPGAVVVGLLVCLIVLGGCVSDSVFDAHKHETDRNFKLLRAELGQVQRDIVSLRRDIKSVSNSQDSLNEDVYDWLKKSEKKLREMEDRVIELRLDFSKQKLSR